MKECTTLNSLGKYIKERIDKFKAGLHRRTPQPYGIACPICGNELHYHTYSGSRAVKQYRTGITPYLDPVENEYCRLADLEDACN